MPPPPPVSQALATTTPKEACNPFSVTTTDCGRPLTKEYHKQALRCHPDKSKPARALLDKSVGDAAAKVANDEFTTLNENYTKQTAWCETGSQGDRPEKVGEEDLKKVKAKAAVAKKASEDKKAAAAKKKAAAEKSPSTSAAAAAASSSAAASTAAAASKAAAAASTAAAPRWKEVKTTKEVKAAIKAAAKHISTTNWTHKNGRKTVQDLINEIENGESVLLQGIVADNKNKLVRLTTAVWVKILIRGRDQQTYYLVERHQFRIDGKLQPGLPMGPLVPLIGYKDTSDAGQRYSQSTLPYYTGKPLSEKATRGDQGLIDTAIRGIKEELHITLTQTDFNKDIQVEYFPKQSEQGGGADAAAAAAATSTALTVATPPAIPPATPAPPATSTALTVATAAGATAALEAEKQQTYKCKTIPNKLPKNAKRIITWHWAKNNDDAHLPHTIPFSNDKPLNQNYNKTRSAFSYPTLQTVYQIIHLKTKLDSAVLQNWGKADDGGTTPTAAALISSKNLLEYFPKPPQCFNTYECIGAKGESVDCQTPTTSSVAAVPNKGGKRRTKKRYKKKKKKRRRKSRKSNKKLKQKRR